MLVGGKVLGQVWELVSAMAALMETALLMLHSAIPHDQRL